VEYRQKTCRAYKRIRLRETSVSVFGYAVKPLVLLRQALATKNRKGRRLPKQLARVAPWLVHSTAFPQFRLLQSTWRHTCGQPETSILATAIRKGNSIPIDADAFTLVECGFCVSGCDALGMTRSDNLVEDVGDHLNFGGSGFDAFRGAGASSGRALRGAATKE
jgi:hypothetical protein